MIDDLYIFCYGVALLLLSITTVGAMAAIWCLVVMHFRNKEEKRHEQQEQEQEETADEKRRRRNAEIINKYLR